MKFIVTVIAAFAAMLSVAIADEWPRKKLRSTTTTAPTPKPRSATPHGLHLHLRNLTFWGDLQNGATR